MSTQQQVATKVPWTKHPYFDYHVIVGSTFGLLLIGLLIVSSASSRVALDQGQNVNTYVIRQMVFAGIGLAVWRTIQRADLLTIRRLANFGLFIVFAMLIAVLMIGTEIYGQRNWIEVWGPIRIQPSEYAKPVMIVWAADLLARRYDILHVRKYLAFPVSYVMFAIIFLVLLEKDLGSAMVMLPIAMAMLFYAGAPKKWFGSVIAFSLGAIALLSWLEPYRVARYTSWLDPRAHADTTGFQLLHGYYALGNGGWFGVGPGGSKEKLGSLPAPHTDFIFAVLGEEMGILGGLTVIGLFAALAYSSFRVAARTRDSFVQLSVMGIIIWILTQALVNIGAVLGVLPITGVTIPLVSYGGSSLIPTLAALGFLAKLANQQCAERDAQMSGRIQA